MIAQQELDFTPRPPAPAAAPEVARLCCYLQQNPGWHTAAQIRTALGYSKRKTRQLAEKSDNDIVSGPGCPGYKHLSHCTLDEIEHATAQLISQGKVMIRRAVKTRNKAHRLLR